MKKIVHIVESFGGGVFTYLVELANNLSAENEVVIVHGMREQTPDSYEEYFNENIKLIECKTLKRELSLKNDIKSIINIRKIISEEKPDIVHLHSSKAGIVGRLARIKCRKFYTPHCYSFLANDIKIWKKKMFEIAEKILGLSSCRTIACSQVEYEAAKKIDKKALVVNNGINYEAIKQYLVDDDFEGIHIYTLGRICEQKNPKMFNSIALALPNIKFHWIGDGPLRGELQSENIKIYGWKNHEEALKITRNMNIFLLTSVEEGLSIALLESMYLRKLCVVSACEGNKSVITESNGFVCNELSDYVKAIKTFSEDNVIDKINDAQFDIINKFNSFEMAKKYKEIYFDLEMK